MSNQRETVLVTGGSRGIGRAIVLSAVRRGFNVAFTYNANQRAAEQSTEEALAIDSEAIVKYYQLDVGAHATIDTVIEEIIDAHGQIHALVNNAAILRNNAAALMSDEEWNEVIATDLSGPFFMIRGLLMHFLGNKHGRVVNILSLAADGSSGQINYAASKAGLIGVTKTIGREYGQKNVTANAVVAGLVDTDMVREHLSADLDGVWENYCPLHRLPTAEEIANVVVFLLTPEAQYINCEIIRVTGGMSYVP